MMRPQHAGHGGHAAAMFDVANRARGDAGRRQTVSVAGCRECGTKQEIAGSDGSLLPVEIVAKKLRQMGWEIGRNLTRHRCPACVAAKHPKKEIDEMPPENHSISPRLAAIGQAAASPRAMTFDERRLILMKLQDVYLDERRGYEADWTDKRVAEDLNVPRAWVEELRSQNFGPVRDNEEVRVLLERIDRLTSEGSAVRGLQIAVDEANKKIAGDVASLRKRVDGLADAIESLARDAARIRKAVGA